MRLKAFLMPAFFLLGVLPLGLGRASEPLTVSSITDGETLKLSDGEEVRLIGIDVPASSKNVKLRGDMKNTGKDASTLIAAGKNAAKFLRGLVQHKPVILEYDIEEKDKSGRRWAYGYYDLDPHLDMEIPEGWYAELVPEAKERRLRVFLNATLIREGYAVTKAVKPNVKHQALFEKLQAEAKTRKRGLWD